MDERPDINESDLLPCPFCGGDAGIAEGSKKGGQPWFYVECDNCHATAESVEDWNRRIERGAKDGT